MAGAAATTTLSYAHGTSAEPLLGETIGERLRQAGVGVLFVTEDYRPMVQAAAQPTTDEVAAARTAQRTTS